MPPLNFHQLSQLQQEVLVDRLVLECATSVDPKQLYDVANGIKSFLVSHYTNKVGIRLIIAVFDYLRFSAAAAILASPETIIFSTNGSDVAAKKPQA